MLKHLFHQHHHPPSSSRRQQRTNGSSRNEMMIIMVISALLLLGQAQHQEPAFGVEIVTPQPLEILGENVPEVIFTFRLFGQQQEHLDSALCFTVINKRLSYYQSTHCLENPEQPYTLGGFEPGVWRVRAYLTHPGQEVHWKGGHEDAYIIGQPATATFLVSPKGWYHQSGLHLMDAYFDDLSQPSNLQASELQDFHKLLDEFPRLRALEIARGLIADPQLAEVIELLAPGPDPIIMLMFNEGHLPLVLNALYSIAQVGLLSSTLVMGIGPQVCPLLAARAAEQEEAEAFLRKKNLACYPLPDVSSFCPHCAGEARDVWSVGFPDLAALKPACVLAGLTLGRDVLWMDTDIVLFRSPMPYFDSQSDLAIQAGGIHSHDIVRTAEQAFRGELCTGFYRARARGGVMSRVLAHTIMALALHAEDHQFGDQAATNLVLFEAPFRGLGGRGTMALPSLQVLDPLAFPGGGIFFESKEIEAAGIDPVIVHNNYIFGMQKKIERFKVHGLWYKENVTGYDGWTHSNLSTSSQEEGEQQPAELPSPDNRRKTDLNTCLRDMAMNMSHELHIKVRRFSPDDDQESSSRQERRVIGTLVIGSRPWFNPIVFPRLEAFASKQHADVVVIEGEDACFCSNILDVTDDEFCRTCAHGHKLFVLNGLLSCYDRVLLVDDTILVRGDTPNLFDMIPTNALGVYVEDERVHQPRDLEALLRLSCLKYEVEPIDEQYFNSGLMLLSQAMVGNSTTEGSLPMPDSICSLVGDQGYFNAMRHKYKWPILDVGYAFNFVGSFEGSNAAQRPLVNTTDAFVVHATTGLPDATPQGRTNYLKALDEAWRMKGL